MAPASTTVCASLKNGMEQSILGSLENELIYESMVIQHIATNQSHDLITLSII